MIESPTSPQRVEYPPLASPVWLAERSHYRVYPYRTMHYEAHQPVLDDLEARITTIRDSL